MAPRIANKDKGELPKPVVKANTLGVYGLSDLSLGLLATDALDCVLGIRNLPETLSLKEKPTCTLQQGNQTAPLELKGRFFNGLSDSFYRGHLPNVLIVGTELASLEHFVEEFLDHVDKLFSLGFFLQKLAPAEELIPNMVLCTPGLYWETLIKRLEKSLGQIDAMDATLLKQIMLKFFRGALEQNGGFAYAGPHAIAPQKPGKIRIAGGSGTNRMVVQSVLGGHGFLTSIESSTEVAALRLELLCAAKRLVSGVLPALVDEGSLTKQKAEGAEKTILETLYLTGREKNAFEELETSDGLVALAPECGAFSAIQPSDRAMLSILHHLAGHFRLEEANPILGELLNFTQAESR